MSVIINLAGEASGTDWVSTAADAATALGILIGLASIVVAFATFDDARASDRRSHFHQLFSSYLTARIGRSSVASSPDDAHTAWMFLKLYTLEELFEWVALEEQLAGPRWFRPFRTNSSRLQYISYWKATIGHHLREDSAGVESHLASFSQCYSEPFRAFAAEALKP